jgi:glycosyltransferase involved in cell wall biosynthesis
MDCTSETKTCVEEQICKRVNYFCKYADVVLGCADLVDTLPRHEGIWLYPIDLSEWQPVPESGARDKVLIVHATNHWKYKGTRHLVKAIDELTTEGYAVELILVEKMSNTEAKKLYEKADIIADQFIGGAYALFAIEGMALGKPVMCYLREDLFNLHPEWYECPLVNTSPVNIKEQLLKLITNRKLRGDLGKKGIDYVKKYHSLESVGSQLDKLYRSIWK